MSRLSSTVILFLIVFFLAAFRQAFDLKTSMDRGKTLYETQCMSCHMPEGEGLEGVYPPLAESPNFGDRNRLVKIVLNDMRGPVKVGEVDYNTEMTGFSLSDEQVSDLLNYIGNTRGNNGATILPKDIQPALKAQTKGYQPY